MHVCMHVYGAVEGYYIIIHGVERTRSNIRVLVLNKQSWKAKLTIFIAVAISDSYSYVREIQTELAFVLFAQQNNTNKCNECRQNPTYDISASLDLFK